MNIADIKQIMENRAMALNNQKNNAFSGGDLVAYAQLEGELLETQATVAQLDQIINAPMVPPADEQNG